MNSLSRMPCKEQSFVQSFATSDHFTEYASLSIEHVEPCTLTRLDAFNDALRRDILFLGLKRRDRCDCRSIEIVDDDQQPERKCHRMRDLLIVQHMALFAILRTVGDAGLCVWREAHGHVALGSIYHIQQMTTIKPESLNLHVLAAINAFGAAPSAVVAGRSPPHPFHKLLGHQRAFSGPLTSSHGLA